MSSTTIRTDSVRRSGAKNILISAFVAVSWYFSLTLVAKRFGGSPGSDAYFFLLSLTTISIGFVGSLLATVFLPALVSVRSRHNEQDSRRFMSSVFTGCLILALVGAIASYVWYVRFYEIVSRLGQSRIDQMRFVLIYFAPIFFSGVLAEFFRVIALALGKFSTSALTAIFQPVLLIVSVYTLSAYMGEAALALALLLSKVCALVLLVTVLVWKMRIRLRITLRPDHHTFLFAKAAAPYWSANVITNLATFYFDYIASGFGAGILSSLAYAQRLFTLPTAVILNPMLEIARTKLAEFQAAANRERFSHYYNNLIRLSLYFSIPIATIYYFYAHNIVSAMFQRGAFTAEYANISATCLKIYALSIPFSCIFLVNGRACESYRRLLWPSVFGTAGNLLMIGLTLTLVTYDGYLGIPLSRLVSDTLYFLPFGFIAIMRFGERPRFGKIASTIAFAGIASAGPALAYLLFRKYVSAYDTTSIKVLLGLVSIFVGAYLLLLLVLDRQVRSELGRLSVRLTASSR